MNTRNSNSTFYAWLALQRKRQDPVGDFAQDCATDQNKPYAATIEKWTQHLNALGYVGERVYKAMRLAFSEFEETFSPDNTREVEAHLSLDGKTLTVLCPFCDEKHFHSAEFGARRAHCFQGDYTLIPA